MKHDDHVGGAPPQLPPVPATAEAVFGARLPLAQRYVEHLATSGVAHGLIGPREVPRLWERHVLNCAVLSELIPHEARVADVGSGAGLPGLCLAIRRPDLTVVLVEPLLRRVSWLEVVIDDLHLSDQVELRRGRAQDVVDEVVVPYVTARAVAPLGRLVSWGLPLLAPGGSLLAIKGRTAQDELDAMADTLGQAGLSGQVLEVGVQELSEPTVVVRVDRGTGPLPRSLMEPPRSKRPRRARRSG